MINRDLMCCRLQHFYRCVTLTMPSFPDAFGRVGRASIVYRPLSPAPCTPWLVEQCSTATRHTHAHTHSSLEYKLYFYACVHIQCNRSTANNSDVVTQDCRRPRREGEAERGDRIAVVGLSRLLCRKESENGCGSRLLPPPSRFEWAPRPTRRAGSGKSEST